MAIVKRSYLNIKALIAGLLAFFTGVAPGIARVNEAPARPETETLVKHMSDSRAYDLLLAQEEEDPIQLRPAPDDDTRHKVRKPVHMPESRNPAGQPAQALKIKPADNQPQQALKIKPGEQPKQSFEAWPAGKGAQPQQALKIKPGEQPQQALKIKPAGEQPKQALKIKPQEQGGAGY